MNMYLKIQSKKLTVLYTNPSFKTNLNNFLTYALYIIYILNWVLFRS